MAENDTNAGAVPPVVRTKEEVAARNAAANTAASSSNPQTLDDVKPRPKAASAVAEPAPAPQTPNTPGLSAAPAAPQAEPKHVILSQPVEETPAARAMRERASEVERVQNLIGMALTEEGKDAGYIKSVKDEARRFLSFVYEDGKTLADLANVHPHYCAEFVKLRSNNPASQNFIASALDAVTRSMRAKGIPVALQERLYTHVDRRKPKKESVMANGNGNGNNGTTVVQQVQAPAAQAAGAVAAGPQTPAPQAAAAPAPVAQAAPAPIYQFEQPPAPMQQPVVILQQPAPQQQKRSHHAQQQGVQQQPRGDGLPAGCRYRVSKRSSGDDGYPPGTTLHIGDYFQNTINGDVQDFIYRNIKPMYGPKPGGADTTYIVEVIDMRGNRLRDPVEIPIAAPMAGEMMVGNQAQFGPRPMPPPQQTPTDRMLELMAKQLEASMARADRIMAEGQKNGQLDAATMLQLMELRRTNEDMARQIADLKKEKERQGRRRQMMDDDFDDGVGPDGFPPPQFGRGRFQPPFGQQPFNFPPAPLPPLEPPAPRPDPMADLAKTVIEKTLASDKPAQQDPAAQMMLELFKLQMQAQIAQSQNRGPDPMTQRMLDEAQRRAEKAEEKLDRALEELRKPEKKGQMAELVDSINALKLLREQVEPPQSPLGFADIAMAAIEHAPAIGQMLGAMAVANAQAPQVQQANGPRVQQQPVVTPPPAKKPVKMQALPEDGQKAIRQMYFAEDEQTVLNALFDLIKVIYLNQDWKVLAKAVQLGFADANSREELRALISMVMTKTGAKKIAGDTMFLDRVSGVLHRHYSVLYKQLAMGLGELGYAPEKVIGDAASADPDPMKAWRELKAAEKEKSKAPAPSAPPPQANTVPELLQPGEVPAGLKSGVADLGQPKSDQPTPTAAPDPSLPTI